MLAWEKMDNNDNVGQADGDDNQTEIWSVRGGGGGGRYNFETK